MSIQYNLKNTSLFKPLKVGGHTLKHRVVQAPTTRARATLDGVPTDLMLENYYKRAKASDGGLIITEATFLSEQGSGWANVPGIYNDKQADAWKIITDKIHQTKTKVSIQLWHLGRAGKGDELKRLGKNLIAPSEIYIDEDSKAKVLASGNKLRAATLEDIELFKKEYVHAAKNAIDKAGFDYVELHGANGYFLDQFIHPSTNKRDDKYGGSIENQARLVLEVVDLLVEAIGKDKIGIRLSPWGEFGGMKGVTETINPVVNFGYLISELNKRKIAYISLMEAKHFVPETPKTLLSNEFVYQVYSGPIFRSGNYTEKIDVIADDLIEDRTLIAVGRHHISNPDIANRLKNDLPLAPYDANTFYTNTNLGYNTYGNYDEELKFDTETEKERKPVALV